MEVQNKENPVAQIDTETEDLRQVALEVLKEVIEVREFFVGIDAPKESEGAELAEETSPWLDGHIRDLRGIKKVMTRIGLNVRRLSTLITK